MEMKSYLQYSIMLWQLKFYRGIQVIFLPQSNEPF